MNQELIEKDLDKKKRGKKTNRFPITPIFLEASNCINSILHLLKEINIISISQFKPWENLLYLKYP